MHMATSINLQQFNCATGILHILYQKGDLIVRNSTIKDMHFVDMLQKQNAFAVGFIQKTIWEKYVWGGERNFVVLICEKNADSVGYLLFTPGHGTMTYAKMQQVAVRNDARRLDYGSALFAVAQLFCEQYALKGFTLRCRTDLEANFFWQAMGFTNYGTWKKGQINHVGMRASRDINLWKIDLNRNLITLPYIANDE